MATARNVKSESGGLAPSIIAQAIQLARQRITNLEQLIAAFEQERLVGVRRPRICEGYLKFSR